MLHHRNIGLLVTGFTEVFTALGESKGDYGDGLESFVSHSSRYLQRRQTLVLVASQYQQYPSFHQEYQYFVDLDIDW